VDSKFCGLYSKKRDESGRSSWKNEIKWNVLNEAISTVDEKKQSRCTSTTVRDVARQYGGR
jgi:hypothetical protein